MDIKEQPNLDDVPVSIDLVPEKKEVKETVPDDEPFHIHHAIIGAGIAGVSLLALFVEGLKPTTRYVVASLGVAVGVALVYDDVVQHIENKCDFSTIFNFVPCQSVATVKKVTKPNFQPEV